MAAGDFNNDGFAELVVRAPFESIGSIPAAGLINVLRGSATGLSGAGSQQFWQGAGGGGVTGTTEAGDLFGSALTSGDFNHDGFSDLSVGVMGENIGSVADAGMVNVLRGSAGGLTGTGSQGFWQGSGGVAGTAETVDSFGFALAAGDFNGDGFVDLAVGVPFEAVGSIAGAGVVNTLSGTASGLTGVGGKAFRQGSGGVPGTAEEGDLFGFALVGGDLSSPSAPSGASAASAGSAGSSADFPAALSRLLEAVARAG